MHKKITKTLLLLTLLVLLVGITSAATITENTTTDKTVKNANNVPSIGVEKSNEKIMDKKEITNKNVKSASKTYDVTDFDTLHNTLTSDAYDILTINIKSDITLTEDTKLNEAIKTLTINGNGKTINGNNQYQFLDIQSESEVNLKNMIITSCSSINGGSIYNEGNLLIVNSTLNNSRASGYYVSGFFWLL